MWGEGGRGGREGREKKKEMDGRDRGREGERERGTSLAEVMKGGESLPLTFPLV